MEEREESGGERFFFVFSLSLESKSSARLRSPPLSPSLPGNIRSKEGKTQKEKSLVLTRNEREINRRSCSLLSFSFFTSLFSSSPAPSQALGTNSSDTPFMQYRSPVGLGPSGKTWPRCPLHFAQWTSVRRMNRELSALSSTELPSFERGAKKEGHPVPLSNLAELEKSFVPQPEQTKVPERFSLLSGLVKGRSVPCLRNT